MSARVTPIAPADVRAVGEFLHTHLNGRVPAEAWVQCMEVPWTVDKPNNGFMLVDDDATVVGVQLALYSERIIDGRRERFCNLAAWCVLPDHRFRGLKLLYALLAQDDYHITDLSPSGNVPALNAKLGFQTLDTTTWIVPNLPGPPMPRSGSILTDPAAIEHALDGEQLALYKDHARAPAARHLVLMRGREYCYVVFRKDRRKQLPLFASLLHVSNPELLRRMARPLARHLLLHHGACATLAERRIVKYRPAGSRLLRSPRVKMFRSKRLQPGHIDYFYSELVCLSW
jgi:hypothetical protein